jgi:hypothetical protein
MTISKITSGYVLKPLRVAPTNAQNTAAPTDGVVRDVKPSPTNFDMPLGVQDVAGTQYRVSFTEGPNQDPAEYLVWAANNSNLALVEDDSWSITEGVGLIPSGTAIVLDVNTVTREDGSSRLVVQDSGGRDIAKILSVKVIRGDDSTHTEYTFVLGVDFTVLDASSGVLYISDNAFTRSVLHPDTGEVPACSLLRQDTITEVNYVLAQSRFWWSRNDTYQTRFAWNGRVQRWEPLRGGAPTNLGSLVSGTSYKLQPAPTGFIEGTYLPGNTNPDSLSVLRVGIAPNAQSTPVAPNTIGPFQGALVVSDEAAANPYNFSVLTPPPAVVVGVTSGVLQWNSNYVALHAGETIWYSSQAFDPLSTGRVAYLLAAKTQDLHITPIPDLQENPLLRLGSRKYLSVLFVATEAEQDVLAVPEGFVSVAGSTGRLRFSAIDLAKSDVTNVGFDIRYLDVEVFYDGVSLNSIPQPLRSPAIATESTGVPEVVAESNTLYVPDAQPLPGLGTSGILQVPDGTGALPVSGAGHVRPGGDDTVSAYSGLLRWVSGVGDTIVFTRLGALSEIIVVNNPQDIPSLRFEIPRGTGYISRKLSGINQLIGSVLEIGAANRQLFAGELLYFLQAELLPATYTTKARVVSRVRNQFSLAGTERLYVSVDGNVYNVLAAPSAGVFTAEEIALHLSTVILLGNVYALNGHVVLEAPDPDSGSIEIGFGSVVQDISGAAALGFLPGWRVDTTDSATFWLPDSGVSVGLFRSPVNLDRAESIPDSCAWGTFKDAAVVASTQPQPYVFLTNPPLRDVAGYDEDVFFKATSGDGEQYLKDLQEVEYLFTQDPPKFAWLSGHTEQSVVTRPTSTINLNRNNVVPATLLDVTGGGLYVAETGGALQRQELDTDYVLDADGATGGATLVSTVSTVSSSGSRGSFSAGVVTFTDLTATFQTHGTQPGYRLKILSGQAAEQSYLVTAVVSQTVLQVSPSFAASSSGVPISWELFTGYSAAVYDPGLLADVLYENFNHLSTEPFKIRLLSSVGDIPVNPTAQTLQRAVAWVTDAIGRGREIAIRFGLQGTSASILVLTVQELGVLSSGLFVPDISTSRFADQAFSIRVGSTLLTHGVNLSPVAVFSIPTPLGTAEYLTTTGELAFAADLLAEYTQSVVLYQEEFLSPSLLSAGVVELQPLTGELNFSLADMTQYGDTVGYFVERMITENRLDVSVNPLAGSFAFLQPLREGQIVETSYYVASNTGLSTGAEITEFLPLYVRSEIAQRISSQQYSFNPTGKTVDTRIEPVTYVDVRRQNYGTKVTTVVVSSPSPRIHFQGFTVDVSSAVTISYAVLEAFGGEVSYSTSQRPIYRPPFFLTKGQTVFSVLGNRTSEFLSGKLLRLGARSLYIQAASYQATTDSTSVTVYPSFDDEVGSRAPGHDSLSLLTSVPITTIVNGVSTTAAAGYLLTVSAEYAPVRKGIREICFRGDLTRFAIAGHVLEVGGVPFLITNATLAEDGATTTIEVAVAFPREYRFGTDVVKLSVRPIYPEGATQLLGLGSLRVTEPFELVLFGERDALGNALPGRTLQVGLDYEIDASTGAVQLLSDSGLQVGQKLFLRYTKTRYLLPQKGAGYTIYPRVQATFRHVTTPSAENFYLGTTVLGNYTFRSPDSFFFMVDTLANYMAEVQQEQVLKLASQNPSGGPIVTVSTQTGNQYRGTLSFGSQQRVLQDQDRVGRTFVDYYNSVVTAFEQLRETFSGTLVGDADGKFRHFVGRNAEFPPPGFEDSITGYLNPRYVWSEVFLDATSDQLVPLRAIAEDYLVDPATASLWDAELSGTILSVTLLKQLVSAQDMLVRNDVDDLVLTQRGAVRATLVGFPPVRKHHALGVFKSMAEPQPLSRLFPQRGSAFTTTLPGIGADDSTGYPGVYAFERTLQNVGGSSTTFSTYKQTIAQLSNPTLDLCTNLTDAVITDRRARARVVSYSMSGYPAVDMASAGLPAMVLSAVPLSQFPIDTTTGLPEILQLRSQSPSTRSVYDIETGNPDLHLPAFVVGNPLALGKADGSVIPLRYAREKVLIQGVEHFGGVYVGAVLSGCIMTFTGKASVISNAADLITVDASGLPLPVVFVPGDTLFVISDSATNVVPADPLTQADIQRLSAGQRSYRKGFDLEVDTQTGEVLDITQSSYQDPSNLAIKELLGQHPPLPQTTIEASISFQNARTQHVEIPALLSQPLNDSGDETIPYVSRTNNEQVLLREASASLIAVLQDNLIPGAIYPDEALGFDGEVLGAGSYPPATLVTQVDVLPVTTAGGYVANSGIGDAQQQDILFVQVDDTASCIVQGSQGILSVGAVQRSGAVSYIEPPRFITQTRLGDRVRYKLDNAMVHMATIAGASGVVIEEVGGKTVLSFIGVGFHLDDGQGTLQGGLNNIFDNTLLPFPNENSVTVDLFDQATGLLLEGIYFSGDTVPTIAVVPSSMAKGGGGTVFSAIPMVIGAGAISFSGTGFVDFAALGGAAPGPVGPFDVVIGVDTYTAGVSNLDIHVGSSTASILGDRLSFRESLDLSTTQPRGATTSGAISIETKLSVHTVTSPDSEDFTVNAPAEVNGGDSFTFLERTPGVVGTFQVASAGGAGDELGVVRVMAWEGWSNQPILSADPVQFSVVPSSRQDLTDVIYQGEGFCKGNDSQLDSRVIPAVTLVGSLAQIQTGDTLVVDCAADPAGGATYPGAKAASTVGTYLVRNVVESDDLVTHPERRELTLSARIGDGAGWVDVRFPRVVSCNALAGNLSVTAIPTVSDSPTTHAFAAAGRVYVLVNVANLANAGDYAVYRSSVVSASYAAVSAITNQFTGLANFQDAGGLPIAPADFQTAAVAGLSVSGMLYFQTQVGGEQGLAPLNVVGSHTSDSPQGLRYIILNGSLVPTSSATELFYDGNLGEIAAAPGAGVKVSLSEKTPVPNFASSLDMPVYHNIPNVLGIQGILDAEWESIHMPAVYGPGASSVSCVLPGEQLVTENLEGSSGFWACAAIFLEPAWPRPVWDLSCAFAQVTDALHVCPQVGLRDVNDYLLAPLASESVHFEVRRIRRFGTGARGFLEAMQKLRYTYEVRRGTVISYATTHQMGIVTTSGVQLGDLNDPDVNIQAGDTFRLVDSVGDVLETALVLGVRNATELLLAPPGLTQPLLGSSFEVYLQQALVPHEQSHAQLLDLVTESVVWASEADASDGSGGYVDTTGVLKDTHVSGVGSNTFSALGVLEGDYVLIDPSGALNPPGAPTIREWGAAAQGDQSVLARVDGSYVASGPSELDDNRGFYRVVQVNASNLILSGWMLLLDRLVQSMLYTLQFTTQGLVWKVRMIFVGHH